jgi:2-dehydro-3-deoxyphosphogluconate aldolase/(4S)-4-hydroxy-2-oxoglutarate aldolase
MWDESKIVETILETRLIAILRHVGEKEIISTAETFLRAGISIAEVTLNSRSALELLQELNRQFGDRMVLGAGTVTTVEDARRAREAGAQFIVTPIFVPEIITYCREEKTVVIPGAMTPTEIAGAYRLGANFVKVFPANTLGLSFFKEIRGPFSEIPLVAVGGVTLENGRNYLDTGVKALGIGSNLASLSLIKQGDWEQLERLATDFVAMAKGS